MLLIAAAILAVVPLLTRSVVNNLAGRDSTYATNFGKATLEELYQLPLDREQLTVGGGESELESCAAWSEDARSWVTYDCSTDPAGDPRWRRTVDLRQYSIRDIYDGDNIFDNPMPGGTGPQYVHLRELGVDVGAVANPGALGPPRKIDLVVLRGF